jgi:hypothetical protein
LPPAAGAGFAPPPGAAPGRLPPTAGFAPPPAAGFWPPAPPYPGAGLYVSPADFCGAAAGLPPPAPPPAAGRAPPEGAGRAAPPPAGRCACGAGRAGAGFAAGALCCGAAFGADSPFLFCAHAGAIIMANIIMLHLRMLISYGRLDFISSSCLRATRAPQQDSGLSTGSVSTTPRPTPNFNPNCMSPPT